jgi:hypothetical protein
LLLSQPGKPVLLSHWRQEFPQIFTFQAASACPRHARGPWPNPHPVKRIQRFGGKSASEPFLNDGKILLAGLLISIRSGPAGSVFHYMEFVLSWQDPKSEYGRCDGWRLGQPALHFV